MMVEKMGAPLPLKLETAGTHFPTNLALPDHSCQWCLRRGRQLYTCNGKLRTEVNQ